MPILIACEESQTVANAFRAAGIEAYSNDILPCSGGHPEYHLQMDSLVAIRSHKWDAVICFPPCTYLCRAGIHWNSRIAGRREKTIQALNFIADIINACKDIPYFAMENSIGLVNTRIYIDSKGIARVSDVPVKNTKTLPGGLKFSMIAQPYNFGHDACKSTLLWLRGFPLLQSTSYVPPRMVGNLKRWANQTDSGQNKLGPSEKRGMLRSKTYPGIAQSMADQWLPYLK